MKDKTKSTAALAIGVIAAAVFVAGSASAADPVAVRVVACAINGGTTTVPPGAPITLHLGGYADGTYGLIEAVRNAQTTTLQVAGTANNTTYNLSSQWSTPTQLDKKLWVIRQPDLSLPALEPGQSVTVTYAISFSHPVAILFPPVGPTGDNGPFVVTEDGPYSCQITA